jgi:voltage-gated potassium channel
MTEAKTERVPAVLQGGNGFAVVIVLTAATFVWGMAVPHAAIGTFGLVALAAGAVFAAIWFARGSRHTLIVWGVIGGAATLGSGLALMTDREASQSTVSIVIVALAVVAPVAIVRSLARQTVVNRQTIGGTVAVYLMIGIFFASLYAAMGTIADQPFFSQIDDAGFSDFLYFSYVTQTTVGFGDLTASIDVGRAAAVVQALTGQLYLVVVLALVVSNLGRRRQPRDAD